MRYVNVLFLALTVILTGCSVTAGYKLPEEGVVSVPQQLNKKCVVETSGSSTSGRYGARSSHTDTKVCTWVNERGQVCTSRSVRTATWQAARDNNRRADTRYPEVRENFTCR